MSGHGRELFRTEALDHYVASTNRRGEVLHLYPHWIRWCYPALIGVMGIGVALSFFTRVPLYASGPSVIQEIGCRDVVSPASGVAESLLVARGEIVERGQPLLLLNNAEQDAEYERVRKEFEGQLANHLRDLLDPTASQQVASLRSQLEFAERMRDLRCVRASSAGAVADIRVQIGQEILPGQVVLTIQSGAAASYILAAVPGRFRPFLATGAPAWLRLEGFPEVLRGARVTSVGTSVIGPKEALRYLGPTLAGSMPLDGPIVLVRCSLRENKFAYSGKYYSLHDGMPGRLELRVQTEPIIMTLVPGLRSLFEGGR